MKKGIIVIAALLLLAGCSKEDAASTSNNIKDNEVAETSDEPKEGNGEGFRFEVNGTTIPMNVDAAPIVEALGEPSEYFEAASCAFQGLDKIFTYNGFEINTYPQEDKDYISSVYFLDDSVTTDKGIYLGASLEEVLTAYGEEYTEANSEYTYTLGETTLSFLIEEDSVASITYKALVEGLTH